MTQIFITSKGPKTIEDLIKIIQEELGNVFKIYCEWIDKNGAARTWMVSTIGSKKIELFQRFDITGQINKKTLLLHEHNIKKLIRLTDNKDILPFLRNLFPKIAKNSQQVIWKYIEQEKRTD